jgi:uncharacterized Tic20 family protein
MGIFLEIRSYLGDLIVNKTTFWNFYLIKFHGKVQKTTIRFSVATIIIIIIVIIIIIIMIIMIIIIKKIKIIKIKKIIYNYGLHEKLISIIIKLRKGYFPEVRKTEGK